MSIVGKPLARNRKASTNALLSAAVLLFASLMQAQAGPEGHWEADIQGDGPELVRVTLDLAKNAQSEWTASMGAPSENATGLVVKDLVVDGNTVKFLALELMSSRFDLTLGEDGNLKGTITWTIPGPFSQSVEFKRTGAAKVEVIPASPAVSKELEGTWDGTVGLQNGAFRMVFHFRNQTDKTVLATFDTASATNLPLNDVKQTGQRVEFGMRVAHGSFQGDLNQEATELVGQFTHVQHRAPLTLRKRTGQPATYRTIAVPSTQNGWDAGADTMNRMTNHLWGKDIVITASTLEFKFAANHSWAENWGENNQASQTVPLTGTGDSYGKNIILSNLVKGTYRFTFNDTSAVYSVTRLTE